MTWTNKKNSLKTPPWIYRETSNRYHSDPIGEQSKSFLKQVTEQKTSLPDKNEKTK